MFIFGGDKGFESTFLRDYSMHLKSMEIFGFKSFPEKTKILFEPGITVVVGPNGCGKSNIVDAFKWVLGEKQAKNLRGDRMEDIIFNGTEHRKPLSLSEVSLSIDNSNRILNIDAETVTISRRVFRDGESEFYINRSPVRLKDIERLFLDTGIGKSSYSVMEQGKIDLILSTKAEDRRFIFEEAAGISGFKLQRRESLKKLAETGENIRRINDIIKEIEREKDIKADQAEKTGQYLRLKEELRELDVKQSLVRYRDLAARRERLSEEVDRLNAKREELGAKVSKITAETERDQKDKNDIQLQLFELDKELHAHTIKVEDIDNRMIRNRRLIEEHSKRRESIEKKIEEREENLHRLSDEQGKTEMTGMDIIHRIDEDRKRLKNLQETRSRKNDTIRESKKNIEERWNQIYSQEGTVDELRGKIDVVIKKLVDAIERRKAELMNSEQERQEIRERIGQRLSLCQHSLQEAITHIREHRLDEALAALEEIDVSRIIDDINLFESFEDGFRSIVFDKTGIHAEKEELDKQVQEKISLIEGFRSEIASYEDIIAREESELEDVVEMITRIEKDLSRNENEKNWIEKHIESLGIQINDIGKQIESYREEMNRINEAVTALQDEIAEWDTELLALNSRSEELKQGITGLSEKRGDLDKKIDNRKIVFKKDEENLRKVLEKITEQEKSLFELDFRMNSVEEHLWNEHEKKIPDLKDIVVDAFDASEIQESVEKVKGEIQQLGPINNLAIEEYRELKDRFDYYMKQKEDIEKAQEDIYSVIEDINKTSIEIFNKTFNGIRKNFSEIFKQLFEGGNAALTLTDEEDVLESGIEIMVRPPGKNLKNINLLSGGEKSLTAIALLFAIYLEKPSPFCFLDEIDAALDEENIGRFLKLLREFSRASQFIIVSHNKKTMSIGKSIYGITMEEPGVSRVVSLRMEKVTEKVG